MYIFSNPYNGRIKYNLFNFKNIEGYEYNFQRLEKNKSSHDLSHKIDDCELKFLKIKLSNPTTEKQIMYNFLELGYILYKKEKSFYIKEIPLNAKIEILDYCK